MFLSRYPTERSSPLSAARPHSDGGTLLDWLSGVKIWDLMFEPDPERARIITNPFTKRPYSFTPRKLRR
jgi:hypothetical protein